MALARRGRMMQDIASRKRRPELALLLAGCLCVIPFVVPYHQAPIPSFYSEWLAGAFGVMAIFAALLPRPSAMVRLPGAATWLLGFALLVAVRPLFAYSGYWQPAIVGGAYVLYAVSLIWLGAQLAALPGARDKASEVLGGSLLAGAVLNALAAIAQTYGVPDWLQDVIAQENGGRAFGNIAQPNLYALYLALGEAGLLFLWARGRLSTAVACLLATLLIWGSALSASRMALMYPVWFLVLSIRWSDKGPRRNITWAASWLCAGQLLVHVIQPALQSGMAPSALSALGRVADGSVQLHLAAWRTALEVFVEAPWWGVGLGQFAGAALLGGLPPELADGRSVWTSPHNLVLQLMAETGVVGTIFVAAALTSWVSGVRHEWRVRSDGRWLSVAVVGAGFMQSMVEYPYWSAHFLAVTALFIGLSATQDPLRRSDGRPVFAGTAACALLAALLLWTLHDYWRLDATRISGTAMAVFGPLPQDAEALRNVVSGPLGTLAERSIFVAVELNREELPEKLALSERVVRYWPSFPFAAKRAIFLAMDGRDIEARSLMQKLSSADAAVRADITRALSSVTPDAAADVNAVLRTTQ
jgi:O-antigen ligase